MTLRIQDIWAELAERLPLHLQESYDNCGLQVGDPSIPATGVLCCVDITEAVLEEALAKGCNMIIAHHPLLFKGLKCISTGSYIQRCVTFALRHELVIYAAHTNADNAPAGLNYLLAEDLGLQQVQALLPRYPDDAFTGSGIIGMLPKPIALEEWLRQIEVYFQTRQLRYSRTNKTSVQRVAICGGAGAFLWERAREVGADALLTGEAKYNDYFDCEGSPILVTVGHYESERIAATLFAEVISQKFSTFAVYESELDSNPIKALQHL